MIESNMNSRNFFNRWIIGLLNIKNIPKDKKLFLGINFILGSNVVEKKGVKSNYFVEDLSVFKICN
jgi:hypothetical protein